MEVAGALPAHSGRSRARSSSKRAFTRFFSSSWSAMKRFCTVMLLLLSSNLRRRESGALLDVLGVELELVVDLAALLGQFAQALAGGVGHRIDLHQRLGTLAVVRGRVGVADQQRAFAPAFLEQAGGLQLRLALALLALGLLARRVGGFELAPHAAAGAELALLAVDAVGDRPVGRDGAAARVGAGVDAGTAGGLLGMGRAGCSQQQEPQDPMRVYCMRANVDPSDG